jgi:hypothetical protein
MKRTIAVVLLLTMNAMAGDLTGKWSGHSRSTVPTTVCRNC